jgi:hypothetical protein
MRRHVGVDALEDHQRDERRNEPPEVKVQSIFGRCPTSPMTASIRNATTTTATKTQKAWRRSDLPVASELPPCSESPLILAATIVGARCRPARS